MMPPVSMLAKQVLPAAIVCLNVPYTNLMWGQSMHCCLLGCKLGTCGSLLGTKLGTMLAGALTGDVALAQPLEFRLHAHTRTHCCQLML